MRLIGWASHTGAVFAELRPTEPADREPGGLFPRMMSSYFGKTGEKDD